jgi:nucleotide-binding universal stress UspA family protein
MTVSTVIGAYEAYSYMEVRKVTEAANTRVEEVKELLGTVTNKTSVQILEGDPASQIIQYAEENNNDVIVMGSRGLGRVREFFLGSVSHNVVQMAKCPVFIVK